MELWKLILEHSFPTFQLLDLLTPSTGPLLWSNVMLLGSYRGEHRPLDRLPGGEGAVPIIRT